MIATHSPGPWFVCGDEGHPHRNDAWFEGRTIGDANGTRVADLNEPFNPERLTANARLIATAPELLIALKAMRRCVEGYIDRCDYSELLKILDETVAKAEGRS